MTRYIVKNLWFGFKNVIVHEDEKKKKKNLTKHVILKTSRPFTPLGTQNTQTNGVKTVSPIHVPRVSAGQQGVRNRVVVHIVLDTVHDHAVHVPRDIQGGEQAREADPREDQLRPPNELRTGDGREPVADERRRQRVVFPDDPGAQRTPFHAVPRQP